MILEYLTRGEEFSLNFTAMYNAVKYSELEL